MCVSAGAAHLQWRPPNPPICGPRYSSCAYRYCSRFCRHRPSRSAPSPALAPPEAPLTQRTLDILTCALPRKSAMHMAQLVRIFVRQHAAEVRDCGVVEHPLQVGCFTLHLCMCLPALLTCSGALRTRPSAGRGTRLVRTGTALASAAIARPDQRRRWRWHLQRHPSPSGRWTPPFHACVRACKYNPRI